MLVFYAQSTGTVISGHEGQWTKEKVEKGDEEETEEGEGGGKEKGEDEQEE